VIATLARRWMVRGWRRRVLVVGVCAAIALNALAYLHARAMVTWSEGGERTRGPEELSALERVGVLVTGVQVPRPTNARAPADVGLEFDEASFDSESGARLAAWIVPADPELDRGVVVLCFHGYAAARASLIDRAAALHELGCTCVLVDFFGSGDSTGTGTTIGVREAYDVAATVEFARHRFEGAPLVLFGNSMGAAAVLRAAGRLGLGSGERAVQGLALEGCFDTLGNTTAQRFHSMGLPAWPLAPLLVMWGGVAADIDGFDHRPVDDAGSVTAPTLMIHAADDRRVTEDQARALLEALGGWTRFALVAGAEHDRSFEKDPERWRAGFDALLTHVLADG
jgi:uncharacterized protein